jgi:hypothetical protein
VSFFLIFGFLTCFSPLVLQSLKSLILADSVVFMSKKGSINTFDIDIVSSGDMLLKSDSVYVALFMDNIHWICIGNNNLKVFLQITTMVFNCWIEIDWIWSRFKHSILRSYIKWRFFVFAALLKQQNEKNQNKNTGLFINIKQKIKSSFFFVCLGLKFVKK